MYSIPLNYISSDQKYQTLKPLLNKSWAMLLDSGTSLAQKNNLKANQKADQYRRYDICVLKPTIQLTYSQSNGETNSESDNHSHSHSHNPQPLEIIKNKQIIQHDFIKPLNAMKTLLQDYAKQTTHEFDHLNLPFNGGWLGYISYDFHPEQVFEAKKDELQMPLIRMGLYQWALITDHLKQSTTLYNFGLSSSLWKQYSVELKALLEVKNQPQPATQLKAQLNTRFKSNISFNDYSKAFKQIQNYIIEGDCYQVNFSQRFQTSFNGDPFDIYSQLAFENNAPFSAFLNFGHQQILSLSPERFIESHQSAGKTTVITQPIKGTCPRDKNPIKDKALALQLSNSEKDKAENLMIVDLLRNDLSKTAAKGTVKVTELFGLYHFESVHHLISTVTSTLDDHYEHFDLLATTLPGGSITGAPKIRAMQIIDELEPHNRGIYCGIIGYLDFKGNMDTNICIRTLVADVTDIANNPLRTNKPEGYQTLYCWAGGGLVADSILKQEYQETFDKLAKILPVLDSTVNQS